MWRRLAVACVLAALLACQHAPPPPQITLDTLPERLSDWHVFDAHDTVLKLNPQFVPYDLNSALFSDYAHKLRAIRVPEGERIRYGEEDFRFPVGTVIAKTFYYPRAEDGLAVRKLMEQGEGDALDTRFHRLIETRLLINTQQGWIAAPYVWNEAQSEAILELAGDSVVLDLIDDAHRTRFEYSIPDANQCAGCHAVDHHRQILAPIGVKARHLNKDYRYPSATENQLTHWTRLKMLSGSPARAPRNARWDGEADLDARARAYLDVNCAHCHSDRAAANTSGLLLDSHQTERGALGICKIPVASGRGSGNGVYDIVPGEPDQSILLYRMQSTEPDVAMPELGRALVHTEGVALIRAWIDSLNGECAAEDQ